MSTEDNLSIVRRFYDAKGDPNVVREVMSPDVVWDLAPGFPGGGVYSGLASVNTDFLAPLAAGFASFGAVPNTFTLDGDQVIAVGHYVGASKGGTSFTARFVHIWTVQDGRIVRNYQIADSVVVAAYLED